MIDTQIKTKYQFTQGYIPQDHFTLQHPHKADGYVILSSVFKLDKKLMVTKKKVILPGCRHHWSN